MSAALFDLDRTLIDCNSGRLWIASEVRDGRMSYRDAAWGAGWMLAYSIGYADIDEVYGKAVATLSGEQEDELRRRTHTWFSARVQHRLRPGAAEALARHRARGDRLVLATSSSLYAAEAARDAFGLDDVICTRFEVRDAVFTGRIASSAFGDHKAERAAEWAEGAGVRLGSCAFYTDSVSDAALMRRVGRPVAVNPDPRLTRMARARGWEVVDWGAAPPP